ncbi:MAG: hypothetical protein IH986_18835, partial [Planctomycetes bacterium]|nr:hypothetical protein [Planctomycetota bacterium]
MDKRIALPLIVGACLVAQAPGQIPRGYEIIEVTNSREREFHADMNNLGQIVFGKLFSTGTSREIFLNDSRT